MTPILHVHDLVKRYGQTTAVENLSFEVHRGEIFGLLGPNGAGKSTTIRIMMDIYNADAGEVRIFGEPPGRARHRVGYLPQERGLYTDETALSVLTYLAQLKGLPRATAQRNSRRWLERVALADRADEKLRGFSGGMQQLVQFIASVVHDPDLVILDEPFAGLDPVNVGEVKALIREINANGKTILLSSHQLNLVEALCDRIMLIDDGQAALYDRIENIREQHSPSAVRVRTEAPLNIPLDRFGQVAWHSGCEALITLSDPHTPQDILRYLVEQEVCVEVFEQPKRSLEDIFVSVVRENDHA
jgi:ABC-2 type transport system ATP-binding protein